MKPGSQNDFEVLAMPHNRTLFSAAMRLTRNKMEAEDLVQEALLRGFKNFHRFKQGSNMRAWLHRIMTNAFINRYRRKCKEREILSQEGTHIEASRLYSPRRVAANKNPESAIHAGVLSETVQRAVDSVPNTYRDVVILSDLMDFSYQEIAEIIGCPVGTVMSRLFRGRQHLRRRLRAYATQQRILPALAAA